MGYGNNQPADDYLQAVPGDHPKEPEPEIMSDLKILAAKAAIAKMIKRQCIYISDIDQVRSMLGLPKGSGEAYEILKTIHCVNFDEMDPELHRALPRLLNAALQGDGVDWSEAFDGFNPPPARTPEVLAAEPLSKRIAGWLR